jgi:hypothetical protein
LAHPVCHISLGPVWLSVEPSPNLNCLPSSTSLDSKVLKVRSRIVSGLGKSARASIGSLSWFARPVCHISLGPVWLSVEPSPNLNCLPSSTSLDSKVLKVRSLIVIGLGKSARASIGSLSWLVHPIFDSSLGPVWLSEEPSPNFNCLPSSTSLYSKVFKVRSLIVIGLGKSARASIGSLSWFAHPVCHISLGPGAERMFSQLGILLDAVGTTALDDLVELRLFERVNRKV